MSVADPGFGQGGAQSAGGPNFETGRIYAWFYRELCQKAQNVCSTLGLGGLGLWGPLDPLLYVHTQFLKELGWKSVRYALN